jgi:hypothetical protein
MSISPELYTIGRKGGGLSGVGVGLLNHTKEEVQGSYFICRSAGPYTTGR